MAQQNIMHPQTGCDNQHLQALGLAEPVTYTTNIQQHICDSGGFEFLAQIINMGIHDTLKRIAFREALFQ